MKRKNYMLAIAAASVGVLTIGISSVAATANEGAAEPIKDLESAEQIQTQVRPVSNDAYGVSALLDTQDSADKIPEGQGDPSSLSQNGVDQGSSRYMGSDSGVNYWLVLDNAGLICLVATTETMTGSGCFTAERFTHGGANIRMNDGVNSVEAYAVNDAATKSEVLSSGSLKKVGTNIFLFDASSAKSARSAFETAQSPLVLFPDMQDIDAENESR